MFRKLSFLASIMAVVVLLASIPMSGFAGRLSYKGGFLYSSLKADGSLTGFGGKTDLFVTLTGSGIPAVTCTNNGGAQAPGQNPAVASSIAEDEIGADETRNGKAPFKVTAQNPTLTWEEGGCASSKWTATVTSMNWTLAVIKVYELAFEGETAVAGDHIGTLCYALTTPAHPQPGNAISSVLVACPAGT